jgi:hypothetical protein
VTLRDYLPRISDARIKLDQYLRGAGKDDPAREPMLLAMRYFEIAGDVWPLSQTAVSAWTNGMIEAQNRIGQQLRNEQGLVANCGFLGELMKKAEADHAGAVTQAQAELQKKPRSQNQLTIRSANTDFIPTEVALSLKPAQLWTCASPKVAQAEMLSNKP